MIKPSNPLISVNFLKRYYYLTFLSGTEDQRKMLVPEEFFNYCDKDNYQNLDFDVNLGLNQNNTSFMTDFVLRSHFDQNVCGINIIIKWHVHDFMLSPENFDFFDGSKSYGFLATLTRRANPPTHIVSTDKHGVRRSIPIQYLDPESFKRWFVENSYQIISQTLECL